MNEIVVTFRGLCALIDRSRWFEVYLPTGTVVPESERGECPVTPMPHVATMAIPVHELDLGLGATTWHPDFVVHHDHVQLACWRVTGQQLTFVQPAASTPIWPADDRKGTIDLGASHPEYKARSRGELIGLGYAVLTLTGGRIRSGRRRQFELAHGNGHDAHRSNHHMAESVEWYPESTALVVTTAPNGNGRITTQPGATVSVTNVATSPANGDQHFAFYYTLLEGPVPCNGRIGLGSHGSHVHARGEDVYDCVPPTTGS